MSENKRFVYADNAATTSVHPAVLAEMLPILGDTYGNPSSLHSKGRQAKEIIDDSRLRISKILGCEAKEIYFTGCGSESDNWAIKGAVEAYIEKNKATLFIFMPTEIYSKLMKFNGRIYKLISNQQAQVINIEDFYNTNAFKLIKEAKGIAAQIKSEILK